MEKLLLHFYIFLPIFLRRLDILTLVKTADKLEEKHD